MRHRLTTAAAVGVLVLGVSVAPASAITGGTVDHGGVHPGVGLVAFYTEDHRSRCSGTLVTETVVLTAAHCTDGVLGSVLVTFDPVLDPEPPSDLPRAADDAGSGTSSVGYRPGQPLPDGFHTGTAHTHPGYSGLTDRDSWNDVGVVVLDEPVMGIAPAAIAPAGYLDRFTPRRLSSTLFRVVGYGAEVRKPASGPQKPTPQGYPLVRRYTDEVGQKLTPQILQVNGNEHDPRGGGGTCFGDSGGPSLVDGYVAAVTSFGYTANCRYLHGLQRVDIPVVQKWLATFGVAPAAATA